MSAAATAAGYLYASGRLRGRGNREHQKDQDPRNQHEQERLDKLDKENPDLVKKPVQVKVTYKKRR